MCDWSPYDVRVDPAAEAAVACDRDHQMLQHPRLRHLGQHVLVRLQEVLRGVREGPCHGILLLHRPELGAANESAPASRIRQYRTLTPNASFVVSGRVAGLG